MRLLQVPIAKLNVGKVKRPGKGGMKTMTVIVQELCARGTLRNALDTGAFGVCAA